MHIEIRNILGIKELEIEPGKINIISGHNAAGKTSVFEAIKTAIEGGNDATLINNDSDSGEIVLVFDNSYQLKRSLERGKTAKVKYTDANGINIPSPQSELNQLFDKIAINPVEFMHQKSKDRTETLLSALNIDIPVDEIKSKLNGSAEKVKFHPQLNGLPLIDNVYEQIFTERTVINRMLKQSQSHAVELSETLKSMDKTDAEELKSEYETLVANKEKLTEKIYDNEKDLTNQKITAIAAFEEEIYDKIEVLKKRLENFKSDVRSKINDRIQSFNSEIAKDREELAVRITEIKAKIDNAQLVKNTQENLTKAQTELRDYQKQADSMTRELETLKSMKTSVTDELPIKGLSIQEGEIFVDDIPYDRLNTAKKLEIALEVAKLRAGKLKLICVDGIEVFDSTTLAKFKELASQSDHQYIMTKVSDEEELTVVSE